MKRRTWIRHHVKSPRFKVKIYWQRHITGKRGKRRHYSDIPGKKGGQHYWTDHKIVRRKIVPIKRKKELTHGLRPLDMAETEHAIIELETSKEPLAYIIADELRKEQIRRKKGGLTKLVGQNIESSRKRAYGSKRAVMVGTDTLLAQAKKMMERGELTKEQYETMKKRRSKVPPEKRPDIRF